MLHSKHVPANSARQRWPRSSLRPARQAASRVASLTFPDTEQNGLRMSQAHCAQIADRSDASVNTKAGIPFFLELANQSTGPILKLMDGTGQVTNTLIAIDAELCGLLKFRSVLSGRHLQGGLTLSRTPCLRQSDGGSGSGARLHRRGAREGAHAGQARAPARLLPPVARQSLMPIRTTLCYVCEVRARRCSVRLCIIAWRLRFSDTARSVSP